VPHWHDRVKAAMNRSIMTSPEGVVATVSRKRHDADQYSGAAFSDSVGITRDRTSPLRVTVHSGAITVNQPQPTRPIRFAKRVYRDEF
jgi:hypothetical protein